jgi:hypothetical protein
MNQTSDHQHSSLGFLHVLPMLVIAVLAIYLWRPANDPAPSPEQEEKIAELVRQLGSSGTTPDEIDQRLRSFGPFPPDAKASRALADGLVTCGMNKLDDSHRAQLARNLYGITVIGDNRARVFPAALMSIQQSAAAAGCSPTSIDELMRAAHTVISTDPNPRRDWW